MRNIVSAIAIASLATQLPAQEQRRTIDPTIVAMEGRRPADFVPRGWLLEREIQGNLTSDSLAERVLMLVEAPADGQEERYRGLVVLTPDRRGVLRRLSLAPRILAEYASGGMKSGTAGENIEIAVTSRRVLVIRQSLGGANTLDYTHRFRFDPATRRLRLIGEDVDNGSPANQRTVTSTNYLTGVRVRTRYDESNPRGVARRSNVKWPAEFLEEVDYETFEQREERTPVVARRFSFARSVGIATGKRGEYCAILPDSTMPVGTSVTLVWPDSGRTATATGSLRPFNRGGCSWLSGDDAPGGAYPLHFSARAQEVVDGQETIAIAVAAPAVWRVGADGIARADLDGDGKLEAARVCTSSEGLHLTLWTGAPLAGVRRWHRYHYLGMDVEANCTERDVRR
jgi:hypothetical protein